MSDKAFTKALIRACKRRVSGDEVNWRQIIGAVAMLEQQYVTDEDIAQHFAYALLDLAQCSDAQKHLLVDFVADGMLSSETDAFAKAVSKLAHTRVSHLRDIGLWDEVETTA